MIEANRAVACLGLYQTGYRACVADAVTGWYGLLWHLCTPVAEFVVDPVEREAAILYRKAERGEPLGGGLTPARR